MVSFVLGLLPDFKEQSNQGHCFHGANDQMPTLGRKISQYIKNTWLKKNLLFSRKLAAHIWSSISNPWIYKEEAARGGTWME